MKTIIIIAITALLYSCKTVHKAAEDQFAVANKSKLAASNSLERKTENAAEVSLISTGIVTTSDNGYDRLIEEQIVEYKLASKDSLAPGAATNKVVKTTRKIKERGTSKDVSVEQTKKKSGFRKWWDSLSDETSGLQEMEDLTYTQRKRLVERTGIPWYAWAGGGVTVSLVFWLKKKYRLNEAHYSAPQKRQE